MPVCTVSHDKNAGTYDLHFELRRGSGSNWNEVQSVANVIKAMIPASHRSYDSVNKIWTLDALFYDAIIAVAKNQHFSIALKSNAEVLNEAAYVNDFFYNTAPAAPEPVNVAKELEVLLGLNVVTTPFDELKRAYRRKALELHPDRNNGDGSRMSELNSIWSMYNAK